MGKKGNKTLAGKPKRIKPKVICKRLDALIKRLEEELEGADLFAPPPPMDDCPICLGKFSQLSPQSEMYLACCGNSICTTCQKENYEVHWKQFEESDEGEEAPLPFPICPFCRAPKRTGTTEDEAWHDEYSRVQARASLGDANACHLIGKLCLEAESPIGNNHPDKLRAIDCFIRAVERGHANACFSIWNFFRTHMEIPLDERRSRLILTIGAIRGDLTCRQRVGLIEYEAENHEVGIRHWKIAAEGGCQRSLTVLRDIYEGKLEFGKEFISKEYLSRVYLICHAAQMKVKSEMREMYVQDEYGQRC